MKKISIRCIIALLIFIISVPPISVFASVDSQTASLTVLYSVNGKVAEGASVAIYRVAEINEGVFKPLSPFSGYPIADINSFDTDGMRSLAYTYAGYIAANKIAVTSHGVSDSSGKLSFNGLTLGLYLVVYSDIFVDNVRYSVSPSLIALPTLDSESNTYNYDVEINVKASAAVPFTKVIKIWENDNSYIRPTKISLQLYSRPVGDVKQNYEKFGEPIILSKKNNWQHSFDNLPSGYEWQIIETEVPQNYNVLIIQQGSTLKVTNNCPEPPPEEGLPSTGTTWYLVAPIACVGLVFVALGIFFKKKED